MFRNKERIIKRTLHSRHYINIEDSVEDSDVLVELSTIDEDVDKDVKPVAWPIIDDIMHIPFEMKEPLDVGEKMDVGEKNEV